MPCTTHHHACECREAAFQRLIEAAGKLQEASRDVWSCPFDATKLARMDIEAMSVRAVLESLK